LRKERRANLCLKNKKEDSAERDTRKKREK